MADLYESIKPLVEDDAEALKVQQTPQISPNVEKFKS